MVALQVQTKGVCASACKRSARVALGSHAVCPSASRFCRLGRAGCRTIGARVFLVGCGADAARGRRRSHGACACGRLMPRRVRPDAEGRLCGTRDRVVRRRARRLPPQGTRPGCLVRAEARGDTHRGCEARPLSQGRCAGRGARRRRRRGGGRCLGRCCRKRARLGRQERVRLSDALGPGQVPVGGGERHVGSADGLVASAPARRHADGRCRRRPR